LPAAISTTRISLPTDGGEQSINQFAALEYAVEPERPGTDKECMPVNPEVIGYRSLCVERTYKIAK
jgi:hypothetical protein